MNEDVALGYVLGTLNEGETAAAEARLGTDAAFAQAVERARADVGDITRGIGLVAEGAPMNKPDPVASRQWTRIFGVAAAVAAIAVAAVMATTDGRDDVSNPDPNIAAPVPGARDLSNLGHDAVAIVTGTVEDVALGREGSDDGMDYAIARVRVDETIKGAASQTIFAFDYVYGLSPGVEQGVWVAEGDRVLLFLASSTGTVHEDIEPEHYQVLHGTAGRYFFENGTLSAPFTLDDVRAAAR